MQNCIFFDYFLWFLQAKTPDQLLILGFWSIKTTLNIYITLGEHTNIKNYSNINMQKGKLKEIKILNKISSTDDEEALIGNLKHSD